MAEPVILRNRVPDAFKGEDVPPAMPARLSPKQQEDARKAARAAEESKTSAEELAELFPEEVSVDVRVLKGRDEGTGRKLREARTVWIEQASMEEWAAAIQPLEPLFKMLEKGGAIDYITMLQKFREPVVAATAALTGMSVDDLNKLRAGDLITMVEAVVKVNRGLFTLRLPMLLGMLPTAPAGSDAAAGGRTSGSPA